jgi:hypothetical protein
MTILLFLRGRIIHENLYHIIINIRITKYHLLTVVAIGITITKIRAITTTPIIIFIFKLRQYISRSTAAELVSNIWAFSQSLYKYL